MDREKEIKKKLWDYTFSVIFLIVIFLITVCVPYQWVSEEFSFLARQYLSYTIVMTVIFTLIIASGLNMIGEKSDELKRLKDKKAKA